MLNIKDKRSILIKGCRYKIKEKKFLKDDDGKICDGLHDHEKKIIWIRSVLSKSDKEKTFFHEFCHAYLYECNVREGIDTQMEEVIVETISQALCKHFDIRWHA